MSQVLLLEAELHVSREERLVCSARCSGAEADLQAALVTSAQLRHALQEAIAQIKARGLLLPATVTRHSISFDEYRC